MPKSRTGLPAVHAHRARGQPPDAQHVTAGGKRTRPCHTAAMSTRTPAEVPSVGTLAALLKRHGLRADRVRPVAQADCEIHRITAGPHELQCRIYPPAHQDRGAIETELDWLQAAADDGLHVPRPCTDRDGLRLLRWRPPEAAGSRYAILLPWLPGRQLDRGLDPTRLRRVGRLIGRLHGVAAHLAQAGRVQTQREAVSIDLARWAAGTRPGSQRLTAAHRQTLQRAATRLQPLLAAPVPRRFIHGDLHPWNLLFHAREAGAIDFTDCGWGDPAMDLASTLQYLKHPLAGNHDHRARYPALRDALFEGLAAEQPVADGLAERVDLLILARLFLTLEWMLDDWPHLQHRAWGPGFLRGQQQALREALGS